MWERIPWIIELPRAIGAARDVAVRLMDRNGLFPEIRSFLEGIGRNPFSRKQRKALVEKLQESPRAVSIFYRREARDYAKALEDAFREAGWHVSQTDSLSNLEGEGVFIRGSSAQQPDAAGIIREAFSAADIIYNYSPQQLHSGPSFVAIVVASPPAPRIPTTPYGGIR